MASTGKKTDAKINPIGGIGGRYGAPSTKKRKLGDKRDDDTSAEQSKKPRRAASSNDPDSTDTESEDEPGSEFESEVETEFGPPPAASAACKSRDGAGKAGFAGASHSGIKSSSAAAAGAGAATTDGDDDQEQRQPQSWNAALAAAMKSDEVYAKWHAELEELTKLRDTKLAELKAKHEAEVAEQANEFLKPDFARRDVSLAHSLILGKAKRQLDELFEVQGGPTVNWKMAVLGTSIQERHKSEIRDLQEKFGGCGWSVARQIRLRPPLQLTHGGVDIKLDSDANGFGATDPVSLPPRPELPPRPSEETLSFLQKLELHAVRAANWDRDYNGQDRSSVKAWAIHDWLSNLLCEYGAS